MRLTLTAMLAAALLLPAPASALPGDPPVEAILPADGAVLPVADDGIEVRYTCPAYTIAGESPFSTPGDRSDYGVYFATSPALGNDGRLLQSNLVDIDGADDVQDNDIPVGQCRGYLAESGSGAPQSTPGTYYWQAWRLCLGCPGDYETGPVRSFRLTAAGSAAKLAVKPPARAYRGFPFVVRLTTEGLDATTQVAVQAKRKGSWSTVAEAAGTGRAADVAVGLPRRFRPGRYPLRATAAVGSETLTSAEQRFKVRKAKGWTTSRRTDGKWTGKAQSLPVEFQVSGRGRTIKAGTFQLTLLCPTPGMINPFTIQIADAPLTRAKIAPDGSFVFADAVQGHASFVRGRIRGRSASGTADLSLGTCTGGSRFSASR